MKTHDDGSRSYVSLADSLASDERPFDDVWGTHAAGDFIYFQTRDRVFRWDGAQFKVFKSASTFRTAFSVYGEYYVRDRKLGLLKADGDSLRLIPNGEFFVERQVYVMAPFDGGKILIGTREEGLFVFDGESVTPFRTEADAWLNKNRLYAGTTVQESVIVLGTLGGGIAVLNKQGELYQVLDENTGLADGWINFVFADHEDGIWLAHHNRGVTRLDVPAELTRYDERHNLRPSIIYFLSKDANSLYVSSSTGLSRLNLARVPLGEIPQFEPLFTEGSVYGTYVVGNRIVAATDQGVEILDKSGNQLRFLAVGEVKSLAPAEGDAFFASTPSGITRIEFIGAGIQVSELSEIEEGIEWLTVDGRGCVWAMTRSREVLQLVPSKVDDSYDVIRYGHDKGVPSGLFVLSTFDDETVIVTRNEILSFVSDSHGSGRFIADDRFELSEDDASGEIRSFIQDQHGRIWIVRDGRVDILAKNASGKFVPESPAILGLPDWNNVQIFVEESGSAWLSNDSSIYFYDPSIGIKKTYDVELPPLIRQVTLVETGERLSAETIASASINGFQQLEYQQNAIRFDVALPTYNAPERNQYQYFLEGHDAEWSAWTTNTHKNYTNLFEGTYRLRVRGMNAHGAISPEAIYTFRILPPWYRTIWAYALYLILFIVLGIFILHYRRMAIAHRKAAEQADELERERLVNERLQESYRRLQEANESLLQADKLKDEFLASTSHELRTPLTAILGFASILKEEVSGEHREFLGMIEENGKRLLHTLNSLLDLAKLRVGMMDIEMRPVDVTRRAHEVGKLLMPLASKKGLELDVRTPSSALYAMLDAHCAERVFYNLIGNAIKFTDEGSVAVVVSEEDSEIKITVTDTGIGIDEHFVPHLFDEFKQESSGNTREHEGTGLGLAITNRLIQIMHGSISVESKKGQGSVFVVTFPKYHALRGIPVEPETDIELDPEQVVN